MNEKKLLIEAIKACGFWSQAKVIWIVSPILEDISLKFCEYVGAYSLASDGKSLIEFGLFNAIKCYQEVMDTTQNESTATGYFIKNLIESSAEVFSQNLTVENEGGDELWNPFVCSASDFCKKFKDAKFSCERVPMGVSKRIAETFMMIKLIPHSLLQKELIAELFHEIKEVD